MSVQTYLVYPSIYIHSVNYIIKPSSAGQNAVYVLFSEFFRVILQSIIIIFLLQH